MTAIGVGLIVALGSVIGEALVNPAEDRGVVIVFTVINALFASLAFSVGRLAINCFADAKSNQ